MFARCQVLVMCQVYMSMIASETRGLLMTIIIPACLDSQYLDLLLYAFLQSLDTGGRRANL